MISKNVNKKSILTIKDGSVLDDDGDDFFYYKKKLIKIKKTKIITQNTNLAVNKALFLDIFDLFVICVCLIIILYYIYLY